MDRVNDSRALLEIRHLTGDVFTENGISHIVRDVNLTLEKGEIHGLVGESGCGKTFTAKSILRLHNENEVKYGGEILYGGRNLLDLSQKEMNSIRGRKIAYVFQNPMTSFDNLFTIGDQLTETIRSGLGVSGEEAADRAVSLLEAVGVTPARERMQQYPYEFSGGMLQRCMIAMAVSCDPEILIADEATTALDVTMQARVLELLKRLRNERGLTILCITHNFGVVAEICDTVSVMYGGQTVESGDVRDIFHHPRHPYTKTLLGSYTSFYEHNRAADAAGYRGGVGNGTSS